MIVYAIIYIVLPALHSIFIKSLLVDLPLNWSLYTNIFNRIVLLSIILDTESGNYTDTLSSETLVTFEVGSSEACFNFSFVVSNDAVDSEHLTLSIMNTTSRTEVEKGLGTVVIHIVEKDSRTLSL